ncbi:ribosome silencing factor [Irregularibacter muris]|uniref:Ribosomal silencing factor RsfS n=1 Tax=Irregularibacter muris TaxID=1796619 RepID=A0AAE3HGI5_9FIRM|nr:ribosome silencing factor [Irregularibacter muris]MCR1900231.1 ribosome silencing factor [Irregularibacter muris]
MSNQAKEMAQKIAEWIDEKKGKDIDVLNIENLSTIADYFVLASGTSTTQVQAIADHIEEKAEKFEEFSLLRKEGYREGRWILLDFNEVIVHVFHEEERDFYKLERLWQDAKNINLKRD